MTGNYESLGPEASRRLKLMKDNYRWARRKSVRKKKHPGRNGYAKSKKLAAMILVRNGASGKEAAKRTGIPYQTVYRWIKADKKAKADREIAQSFYDALDEPEKDYVHSVAAAAPEHPIMTATEQTDRIRSEIRSRIKTILAEELAALGIK